MLYLESLSEEDEGDSGAQCKQAQRQRHVSLSCHPCPLSQYPTDQSEQNLVLG